MLVPIFIHAQESKAKADTTKLSDYQDTVSYILGRDVGGQIKKFGTDIRIPQFVNGLKAAIAGSKSIIDSLKSDSIRQAFAAKIQENMAKEEQALANENQKKSKDFLDKNKKNSGIQTTASGLQYKVVKKGNGPKPAMTDSVMVTYKGMLQDGAVFDSTPSNQPVPLQLQRTIPGLAEGIQLMNEGATYKFFVPPELAYGPQGAPPRIPPNAVLVFDVTLSKVMGVKK